MSHLLQQQVMAVPLQPVGLDMLLLSLNNRSHMSKVAQTLTGSCQTVLSKAARTSNVNNLSKRMTGTPCKKALAMLLVHMLWLVKSQGCSQTLLQTQASTAAQSKYFARMKWSRISVMAAFCVALGQRQCFMRRSCPHGSLICNKQKLPFRQASKVMAAAR